MENRIAKIAAFAAKRDAEAEQKRNEKEAYVQDLLDKVRGFAPRMRELLKVGQFMYENGIPLGHQVDILPYSVKFVSNGVSHKVGFIRAYRINGRNPNIGEHYPIGFGIEGGGCDGQDLLFNADGELEWINAPYGMPAGLSGRPWGYNDIKHLEQFVRDFDKFEKEFYEYVDNL